jgi:hypothetical protein
VSHARQLHEVVEVTLFRLSPSLPTPIPIRVRTIAERFIRDIQGCFG